MSKINSIVAGLATLGVVTATNAQQVIKRITDNTNATTVEFFVLRNGTSLPNTIGESNFDTGSSDGNGNVIIYNPTLANTYSKTSTNYNTSTHNTETAGNGTFVFNQSTTKNVGNFIANGGSGTTLNMTISEEDGNADNMQDGNTLSDMLYSKFVLPKTLNDGSAIPNGLIVICVSRRGADNNTGATAQSTKRIGFQRNQADLSRAPITSTATRAGTLDNLQEIGTDGQLGNEDFVTTPTADFKMYPNPAQESITLDKNNDIPYETFDIEIYDSIGREVIGRGSYTEGQPLDISMLADGQYVVKCTTEDKQTTTQKLIKK